MNKKKMNPVLFALGSLTLAAVALLSAPRIIEYFADQLGDSAGPRDVIDDEDWGPEIVRRVKPSLPKEE